MTLFDAYNQAIDEENDPAERGELSASLPLKTLILEEIMTSMKEIRDAKRTGTVSPIDMVKPLFSCVSFWFIVGIRVGKILRDEELSAR